MHDKKEIFEIVRKINSAVQSNLWFDFEVVECSQRELSIIGSLSTSYPYDIKIIFKDIFAISLPLGWKTDTAKKVLQIVQGKEAQEINKKFRVEHGYYLFKFFPEDYEDGFGCLVVAKDIDFSLHENKDL